MADPMYHWKLMEQADPELRSEERRVGNECGS